MQIVLGGHYGQDTTITCDKTGLILEFDDGSKWVIDNWGGTESRLVLRRIDAAFKDSGAKLRSRNYDGDIHVWCQQRKDGE